ncbi:MAG: CapA family protein [Bacteroidia bacterium]|nr:CapA family protein [Bacteroidia bacterium]MCX7652549.1 CapA family protein [Bacteroidia bacterium]MDW8417532.1 CapA family protein [Bacteroidia bacterium]
MYKLWVVVVGGWLLAQEAALHLTLSGDNMIGTFVLPEHLRQRVLALRPYLSVGDIRFTNVEGNFVTGKEKPCKCSEASRQRGVCFEFGMPVQNADLLKEVGFNLAHLDNNHTEDYGVAAYESTKRLIENMGITTLGKRESKVLEINGLRVGLIAFGFSGRSYHVGNIPQAVSLVQDLARKSDVVIVSFHGGAEGSNMIHTPDNVEMFYGENRGHVRAFARAVIDAGADLVVGHGPHVMRGMELYKGRLVLYSLGNFIVVNGISTQGPNGLTGVFEVSLDKEGRFLRGKFHPMRILQGIPTPDEKKEALMLLRRLTQEDFQGGRLTIREDGEFVPASSQ